MLLPKGVEAIPSKRPEIGPPVRVITRDILGVAATAEFMVNASIEIVKSALHNDSPFIAVLVLESYEAGDILSRPLSAQCEFHVKYRPGRPMVAVSYWNREP
jgi:hypothetical protein